MISYWKLSFPLDNQYLFAPSISALQLAVNSAMIAKETARHNRVVNTQWPINSRFKYIDKGLFIYYINNLGGGGDKPNAYVC